ncbi:MAG: transglutaminase domain-containing protein, partial [Oscillospiraceae bacterium]
YKRTKEQYESRKKTLYAAADKVVENAGNYTAYDKIRYFHDYLIKKCTYTVSGPDIYSAYGCLVDGKAVCEGYSKAFSILCQRAGITNVLVSGQAVNSQGETEGHMWNKVYYGNEWYNVDVTWDDMPSISTVMSTYDYYFVNDEGFKANHSVEQNRFVKYPDAVNMKSNYYVLKNLYVSSKDDPVEMFKTAASNAVKNQSELITLKFCTLKQLEEVYDYINADDSTFGDLLATRCHDFNAVIDFKNVSYASNDAMKIITVKIPFIKQ